MAKSTTMTSSTYRGLPGGKLDLDEADARRFIRDGDVETFFGEVEGLRVA